MKKRNYKNRDFSNQFNNITLSDICQKIKNIEPTKRKIASPASVITEQNEKYTNRDKLYENFIPRMLELDPIVPDRYIWHLTYPCCDGVENLRSFSIASEGLRVSRNRCGCAVFAHNRLYSISQFYPFIFDYNDLTMSFGGLPAPSSNVLYSDFWKIDTHAYKGKWYIDPNMKNDFSIWDGMQPINFICTPEDVPSCALKLYKLTMDVYLASYKQLELSDAPLLSTSLLRPNDKVNEWVRRKRTAA
ncbi:MAG: hypothetical protein WCK03_03410 [Candidatus Taylorbacteria bacterium]